MTIDADGGERLPGPVEIAAYFVVSEALANVAKYAQATEATVAIRRADGSVTVEVTDDGVGRSGRRPGLGPARTRGPRGGARRHAVRGEPAGQGTRLRVEIPVG